jgi:WD40 repeat protein
MLKASAALGEGASASLSRSWVVSKSHSAAYSGGAVKVAGNGSVMACLLGGDVAFLDVESGQVTRTLRGKGSAQQVAGASATDGDEGGWEGDEEEEEEVVCLALHPSGGEMVTASRNLLLRRWSSSPSQFKCIRTIKAHDQVVKAMEYDR